MSTVRTTLKETLFVSAIGVVLGVAANALSPRGLSLTRNYFPDSPPPPVASAAGPASAAGTTANGPLPGAIGADAARETRLAKGGWRILTHESAARLFRDARFAEGRIVFIDARDDRHYQAGHIQGAYQLDHYRLDKYVTEILGACQLAEQIVVYCSGGECEDSELAARDLLDFGIPAAKLAIYAGGIGEWQRHGLPIETGARGSVKSVKP